MKFSNLISNKSLNRILKILSLKFLFKSDVKLYEIIRSILTNQNIEKNGYVRLRIGPSTNCKGDE